MLLKCYHTEGEFLWPIHAQGLGSTIDCENRTDHAFTVHKTCAVGVISAADLFLNIQFEHANQPGNWFGELQSCGGVAGYQRT